MIERTWVRWAERLHARGWVSARAVERARAALERHLRHFDVDA